VHVEHGSFATPRLSVVLLWYKSLDVVVGERNMDSFVIFAAEDVVTLQVAWVEARVVGRRELSTALLIRTSYVEQARCPLTHNSSNSYDTIRPTVN